MPLDKNRFDSGDGQQPPTQWKAHTASDTEFADGPCRAFIVGGSGTVVGTNLGDNLDVVLPATIIVAGVIYPAQFTRIKAASTATDIWVLR